MEKESKLSLITEEYKTMKRCNGSLRQYFSICFDKLRGKEVIDGYVIKGNSVVNSNDFTGGKKYSI